MPISKVSQAGLSSGAQFNGFKNRIINGGMDIDQRNAGASVSLGALGASVITDRFFVHIQQGSGHTAQRSAVAPAGFVNSLLITVGTGASPTAGQVARIYQGIEGFNVADLGWGTANAQTITLSFWVRSSLTGTFAGGVYNNAANRTYVFTYTINSANTWEQKTLTIAGDTSGTWATDNTAGMYVNWDFGTGSTYQGTAGVWAAGAAWATSGSVKLAATSGATFYITGVQLEKGSAATSFDYRPYGTELMLCQRYCLFLGNYVAGNTLTLARGFSTGGTAGWRIGVETPVSLRAMPTLTPVNLVGWSPAAATTTLLSIGTVYSAQGNNLEFDATFANNTGSSGSGWAVQTNTGSASYLLVSAEL